jgi:hypothetical protein
LFLVVKVFPVSLGPLLSFASSPPFLQDEASESKLIMASNPSHNRAFLLNIN